MFSYPFHIRDYLTKTRHLSQTEDLAYRRLLDTYYTEETPLPSDAQRCARLIAMPEAHEAVALVLQEFFELRDDGWHNDRCDHELDKYHAKADRATKANAKRWESKTDLKSDKKSDLKSETDQIPTSKPKKPRTSKPVKTIADTIGFDDFWSAYPRKTAKTEAVKSWLSLDPDEATLISIMNALKQFKRSDDWMRDGGKYIPYPATWINQQRWQDDLSKASLGEFDFETELRGAL